MEITTPEAIFPLRPLLPQLKIQVSTHTDRPQGIALMLTDLLASTGGDVILADGYSETEEEIVQELREGKIAATFLDGSGQLLAKCVQC